MKSWPMWKFPKGIFSCYNCINYIYVFLRCGSNRKTATSDQNVSGKKELNKVYGVLDTSWESEPMILIQNVSKAGNVGHHWTLLNRFSRTWYE